ncbi:hypothetical protein LTR85_011596 [Meristemomyces frigidus]|nr:hypothetical protein LTR85_011596 [Meristemomyces frigidus]
MVKLLLERGARVMDPESPYNNLHLSYSVCEALRDGKHATIRQLVRAGLPVNSTLPPNTAKSADERLDHDSFVCAASVPRLRDLKALDMRKWLVEEDAEIHTGDALEQATWARRGSDADILEAQVLHSFICAASTPRLCDRKALYMVRWLVKEGADIGTGHALEQAMWAKEQRFDTDTPEAKVVRKEMVSYLRRILKAQQAGGTDATRRKVEP